MRVVFERQRPVVEVSFPSSPALHRAAEYRAGRKLTDQDAVAIIRAEIEALVAQWAALGRWVIRFDTWGALSRPKLSRLTTNNPSEEERNRRSVAMRKVWAAKRARGERLPCAVRGGIRDARR